MQLSDKISIKNGNEQIVPLKIFYTDCGSMVSEISVLCL